MEVLNLMYAYTLIPGYQNGTEYQLTNIFWELAGIFNVKDDLYTLNSSSSEEKIDGLSDKAKEFMKKYNDYFGIPKSWQPMNPYARAVKYLNTGEF